MSPALGCFVSCNILSECTSAPLTRKKIRNTSLLHDETITANQSERRFLTLPLTQIKGHDQDDDQGLDSDKGTPTKVL